MYAKDGSKLTAEEEFKLRELATEYKKRGYFTDKTIEEVMQLLSGKRDLY